MCSGRKKKGALKKSGHALGVCDFYQDHDHVFGCGDQMTTEKMMLSKSPIMQMFPGHVQNGGGRTNRSKPICV